jgi:hypothetical protein
MTNDEWKYHRVRAVQIEFLGLCSKTKTGLIKTEGYEPCSLEAARARVSHLHCAMQNHIFLALARLT